MPPSDPGWQQIDEKLAADDDARRVERQVNKLDRQALDALYGGTGSMPFDPVVLLKMVLYQYHKGRRSPATWFEEAKLNDAMKWLGRGYTPARRTWYEFRDRVGDCIEQLHQQVVEQTIDQGLVNPEVGVQDGTSVAACASRHRMVNRETLDRRKKLLDDVIRGTHDPTEKIPLWVPPTTSGRENLAARMQIASEVLNERIAQNAAKQNGKRKDPGKITVSLSDPIAPLGRDKFKVFRPLYTVQYVVEPTSRLILSYGCEAAVSDVGTLIPMIDKTQKIVGGRLRTMLADSAYCSIMDLLDCQAREVELLAPVQSNTFSKKSPQSRSDAQVSRELFTWNEIENSYRCPEGHELNYCGRVRKQRHGDRTIWESRYRCSPSTCAACPLAKQCLREGSASRMIKRLEGQELLEAQREKMNRPDVQARYASRGETVELSFADARSHRRLVRFHGRGLSRARTETGLLVLAQNLLRRDRLEQQRLNSSNTTT